MLTFLLHFNFFCVQSFYIDYLENKNKLFGKIPREFLIGLFFGLNLVIRINAIAFLGALSIFNLILLIKNKLLNKRFLISELKIYITAIVVLYILTPPMWLNALDWINFAIVDQFKHPNIVLTVVNGTEVLADSTGRFYLVIWFVNKLPIIFLVCFLIYLFNFVIKKSSNIFSTFALYFIFYVQILFMVFEPNTYDGLRHFLFVIPFFLH